MEMLRSEVKLLLLRNSELESENLLLKQNEIKLTQNLFKEKRLNKVLENIKLAQNEYISKLNLVLIELTQENGSHNYNQIRNDINSVAKICKQLQHEYEICKQLSFDSSQDCNQSSVDTTLVQSDNADLNEGLPSVEPQDIEEEEEEEEEQMPELDLIEPQLSDSQEVNNGTDVDEDDDPNGAGEQYLDRNDKEFVPKGNLPKNARKSFPLTETRVQTNPHKRKHKEREYKTSQKFGDKFRCNWKGCVFISSYKQNVERHYRVHTGERPFKCQYKGCGFSASQAGNLKVHQQRHGHQSPVGHKIRVKSTPNACSKVSPKKDQK